jgi:hypothetical protein
MRANLSILSVILLIVAIVSSGNAKSRANPHYPPHAVSDSRMSERPRTRKVPIGVWGGQHIRLEVTAREVSIEYDCAHATINQSITLDRNGRFNVSGMQFREHGGPVRPGLQNGYPARFAGQVKGSVMTLTVTDSNTNESIGTFTLKYGQQPRLMKCK